MSNISFNISTTKPKISYDIKLMKTGKSEYSGTFDLSMPDGDQVITPNEGRVFSAVTVKKPETMVPENIRKGTDIGGVVGTMLPQQPDMYQQLVDLNKKLVGLNENSTVTNYDFLENLDTSKVIRFERTFYNDSKLERVPENWDTSNVTSFYSCFYNCSNINLPKNWDYSKGARFDSFAYNVKKNQDNIIMNMPNNTTLYDAFYGCDISNINLITSENLDDLSYCFQRCNLTGEVNISNTSNVTKVTYMFAYSYKITEIPNFNFQNVTNADYFIYQANNVKKVSNIFGNKVINFYGFAHTCRTLEDCELDMLSCTNSNNMFYYCQNLTNLKLHNIKINVVIGSGTSYGTKLTQESLIFCIKELWSYKDTTTKRTLTMSTPSKTLIADVYVKLITPTQEQIEADPYINNKLPCEVCESTDEGAMTITAYANLKNWTIA